MSENKTWIITGRTENCLSKFRFLLSFGLKKLASCDSPCSFDYFSARWEGHLRHLEGAWSKALNPFLERSQMRWFWCQIRMPPFGDLLGTSNWWEAPGRTQNFLKGLYFPAGLRTPWDPQGRSWKASLCGEISWILSFACCHWDLDSSDGWTCFFFMLFKKIYFFSILIPGKVFEK